MDAGARRDVTGGAVAAERGADIGDAVALLEIIDALADGDDLSRRLMAGTKGYSAG
jgi:hypothetical protein